jgi:group I intron endonuclease
MGYIYLITNTVTKKQYIGQTLCEDVERRWKQHKWPSNKNKGTYIANAFNKHGIESFKFQIICICFDEDCNIYEEQYIKKFNTLVPNGYNLQAGGNNHKCHLDTKKKLSDINKGKNNPQYGKKWSKELREKRKKETIGDKNPNFGKKSVNRKLVGMYDLENKLIETFNSIHEASEKTNINKTSISGVCNGKKHKKAGGFLWKFISDQPLTS